MIKRPQKPRARDAAKAAATVTVPGKLPSRSRKRRAAPDFVPYDLGILQGIDLTAPRRKLSLKEFAIRAAAIRAGQKPHKSKAVDLIREDRER
jgi:hypothetical protein